MDSQKRVAVLVGSLRKQSFTRKTAQTLAAVAPTNLKLDIIEIGQLPLYNEDDELAPPASWLAFREAVRAASAVLFVTPEYNRSVPAALKNAIDVASRPYGSNCWDGKPAAIVSVSPGVIGGFCASRWCSSTCRRCSSPRPISAAPLRCSTPTASLSIPAPPSS